MGSFEYSKGRKKQSAFNRQRFMEIVDEKLLAAEG